MANSVPHAVQSCHDLLLWLIPHLDKFPRLRRFTLGERLETQLLMVLEFLVEAAYSRQKNIPLAQANLKLETCRHLWRLAFELKVIPVKRYEYGARLMNELGKEIGGWLKSSKTAEKKPT